LSTEPTLQQLKNAFFYFKNPENNAFLKINLTGGLENKISPPPPLTKVLVVPLVENN